MIITNEEIKMRLHYAKQQSNALMRQMVEVVEQLLAAAPLVAVSDNDQMPKLPTPFTTVYCEGDLLTDPGEEVPCYSPTQMRGYSEQCFLASQVALQATVLCSTRSTLIE